MVIWKISILTLVSVLCSCAVDTDDSPIVDPVVEAASISVLNVSRKTNLPSELQIEGLFSGKSTIQIASSGGTSRYEEISAGVRHITLGSHRDTIHINKGNFYTLMIYDNDSTSLNHDASYTQNVFQIGQQLRWTISGDVPENYSVDIYADSLIKHIPFNRFVGLSSMNNRYRLDLYKAGSSIKIGSKESDVRLNQNCTFNIKYDTLKEEYEIATIIQQTK